jgi:hypothetical protein
MLQQKTIVKRIKGGVRVERSTGPRGWTSRADYFRDASGVVRLRTKMDTSFFAPRVGARLSIVQDSAHALRAHSAPELLEVIRKAAGNREAAPDPEWLRKERGEITVRMGSQRLFGGRWI